MIVTTLWQDVRFAARLLLRTPAFTLIAVVALALGIGANTAIFSVVNTLILERLPYKDPARLVVVWERNLAHGSKNNVTSPANFLHWREMNRVFEDLAMVSLTFRTTVTGDGAAPEELPVQYVTAALSPILGVPPQQGRVFAPPDDDPSAHVVIISDRLWKRRFGADPGIVNRAIQLNGRPQVVIGVMPSGFSILDKTVDVWQPIGFDGNARTYERTLADGSRPPATRRDAGAGTGRHDSRPRGACADLPCCRHRMDGRRCRPQGSADR